MASKINIDKGFKKAQRIASPFSPHKRLYTLAEAGGYLGRSVYSVRTLIWAGKIPIVKDGKKQWVDIVDLDLFIERNKTTII